ncbi:hypothetical protein ASF72_10760 [Arthrobacter sp. Leaf141]|uniref:hypothetical protein n=1 Tax=Arthrobacter sp. Leaf141 TaxID=1736273 RepID=UPI0006F33028|nr:hypothetical protein [Arthrobacter sp. Leaf141]KQR02506.1 hypothetical protein ASF72_10760 [Arthrobacter sp. Leaf141]
MTEQPTEQEFLGNARPGIEVRGIPLVGTFLDEHTRMEPAGFWTPGEEAKVWHAANPTFTDPPRVTSEDENIVTDLHLEAEVHSQHAVKALENGDLVSGIAWLRSSLAFAEAALSAPPRMILGAQQP